KPILFIFGALLVLQGVAQEQEIFLEKYRMGEGIRFTSEKGYTTRFNFMVQPWGELRSIEDEDIASYRLRIRRARLMINSNLTGKLSFRVAIDFSQRDGNVEEELLNGSLLDAYFTYNLGDFDLSIGQRSLSSDSRELRFSSQYVNLVERSRLVSSFASIRDFGVFIQGRHHLTGNHKLKTYLEIITGDGQSAFIRNYGGLKYGGRLDYFPNGYLRGFGQFRGHDLFREWVPKIVLGVFGSYNDGISSRRGRRSGSIIYLDADERIKLPDYGQLGVDLVLRYRGLSFLAEVIKSWSFDTEDIAFFVRSDGSLKDDFPDGIKAEVDGRLMMGESINAQLGYTLKNSLSFDARYTWINPDEFSFLNNDTFFNRNEYYGAGVTQYFFNNTAKIQADVQWNTTADTATGVEGIPTMGRNEVVYRILTQIQF
ncbi:MAG: porin, partial [Bacteroidota bacterium]